MREEDDGPEEREGADEGFNEQSIDEAVMDDILLALWAQQRFWAHGVDGPPDLVVRMRLFEVQQSQCASSPAWPSMR